MPRVVYFGPDVAIVPGLPAFDPGEARDVGEDTAVRLLRNRHFGLVETDAAAPSAATTPAPADAPQGEN